MLKRLSDTYLPTSPALLVIGVVVLIPIAWLFALSFVDAGIFSLVHYERVLFSGTYIGIFITTLLISVYVTVLAAVLGYPIAYFIYMLPRRAAKIALFFVMLPLWTSVLVRTISWLILFQRRGPINETLQFLQIVERPLQLNSTMLAATVGMTHIVLPLFVMPTLNAMRQVDKGLLTAAASLGARDFRRFWSVFFPLTTPGVIAGSLLVFIYSLGFYITPQILGGGKIVTVSMKVAENATMYSEWGASSSLAVVLLVATLVPVALLALINQRRRSKKRGL
ncbi:ABC transporter permease [Paracoccus pantotrophus]|uniref:ABC transporter permease n=1 Tax=Paracoccus pantotrophus TaxID=82367 RepID=A0A7H9BPV4_PARPN|nr:ABC transporter permease [Paracoccus pantotrophus]QLH13069.1 ABC transporter permease [Paracoccus pantotrophus]